MDTDSVASGFQDVDKSGESDYFIDYLKFIDSIPEFRSIKERSYISLDLKPGATVLDAGCGLGFDTCRMASLVGAQGRVVGLDSSRSMVSVAEQLMPKNLPQVEFRVGDIRNPDFEDETFDSVFIERLLQISPDPKGILNQITRILKPGGTLVITEPDWGTMALDPGNKDAIRSLISFCADSFSDGWTGRKLYRHLIESGLNARIEAEPVIMHNFTVINRAMNFENFISGAVQSGKISQTDADDLMEGFWIAGESGIFFFSYMIYRAIGKKKE